MKLNTRINGKDYCLEINPNAMLVDVLRQAGLKSVKFGCGEGSCGCCAVMIDGKPRNSCITLAGLAEGAEILTVEGMGNPQEPHALQQAFVDSGSTQCGYCNPGSLIAAKALLDSNPNPSAEDVKDALDGNLCRCTGYVKRIDAVLSAAKAMKKSKKTSRGKK
ncbi:MAG: aerobic carbon-monoxide dehydrogenase small subunit [Clostridiales bacterium]|nr:aerobic carbon-monoxide dehydrogenase small subunit [Clostridiales bacterium]MDN5283004.1 aerobic carbon-monoxide dehydrogenase small subunit [Candidatus Ozemobacter sp.]